MNKSTHDKHPGFDIVPITTAGEELRDAGTPSQWDLDALDKATGRVSQHSERPHSTVNPVTRTDPPTVMSVTKLSVRGG